MTRALSPSELLAMQTTERVTSALSLLGFLFILVTYLGYEEFNKPINRLIFYASWSNLGTTIAGLIGESGVLAGQDSALCQAQAFIIQLYAGHQGHFSPIGVLINADIVILGSRE